MVLVTNQVADVGNLLIDEFGHIPARFRAADIHGEVLQELRTTRRMRDLGVELDAFARSLIEPLGAILSDSP